MPAGLTAGQAAGELGWIGGARFDRVVFFGASALAALVGGVMLALPRTVVLLWWAWLLLLDGPHLLATWTRSYLDPVERRERAGLLWASWLWLLPGPALWALGRALGSTAPFTGFLGFATLWSWHHAVRQNYGLVAIYDRLAGATARQRRLDWWFVHGALWALFGLFVLMLPANRVITGLPAELPAVASAAGFAGAGLLALAVGGYAVLRLRGVSGRAARPVWFALLPVLGLYVFALFVVGVFEPLAPHPENPEQVFLAVAVVGGIVHGAQYLGIVGVVNRRRHASTSTSPSTSTSTSTSAGAGPEPEQAPRSVASRGLVRWLAARPLQAWAIAALLSVAYLVLNAARGTSPGVALLPASSAGAELCLCLYWGLFFHHYYLDQKIWRPHSSAALRRELGVAGERAA